MANVRFSRRGIREAREARDWLKDRQPKTVDGFRERLRDVQATLAEFPNIGSKYGRRTRRLPLTPYPYFIVYRLVGDEVEIVAVPHAKQLPR
jgi:toxin ParE1/3/4